MHRSKKTRAAPRDPTSSRVGKGSGHKDEGKSGWSGRVEGLIEANREQHEARKRRKKQEHDLLDRTAALIAESDNRRRTRSAVRREKEMEKEAKQVSDTPPLVPAPATASGDKEAERKPWETTVIGASLGSGLTRLQYKDRQILQRRFIIAHHEKNSPENVAHNRRILEDLIQEREAMEGDEESHKLVDEVDAQQRVAERVKSLHWALDTCECAAEADNIRAALEGYASGRIECSEDFTLLYGGHIVDKCPTYRSFCADRQERIRRYAAQHGAGWLWIEPPLAGPDGGSMMAKKGMCLDLNYTSKWDFGHYEITMGFEIDMSKIMGEDLRAPPKPGTKDRGQKFLETPGAYVKRKANFNLMLDSGATAPLLCNTDLKDLDIDTRWYAAQGINRMHTANGSIDMRFYEMYVSICTRNGESLVDPVGPATWHYERRELGAFVPVSIQTTRTTPADSSVAFLNRLSGMLPFDASYITSAAGQKRVWFGEDRIDVLGASRFPAHQRYDTEKEHVVQYPLRLDIIRETLEEPESMFFAHSLIPQGIDGTFIDSEGKERGLSQWKVIRYGHGGEVAPIGPSQGAFEMPGKTPWRETYLNAKQIRRMNAAEDGG